MNSQQSVKPSRLKSLLPFLVMALVLALVIGTWAWRQEKTPEGNLTGSSIVSQFSLVDEDGRRVTSDTFNGQWRLMYFGFTFCPDICPTDAAKIAAALRTFEAKDPKAAANLQPIFITVDPERDDQAALKEFTDTFHPRLLGLTGTRAEIDDALKNFRIFAKKVEGTTPDSYSYDHLAVLYLVDPKGQPVEFVASTTATAESITEMLERFVG